MMARQHTICMSVRRDDTCRLWPEEEPTGQLSTSSSVVFALTSILPRFTCCSSRSILPTLPKERPPRQRVSLVRRSTTQHPVKRSGRVLFGPGEDGRVGR
ncbi:hypothetical protein L210DRAFT_2343894 [Boletus edulis BED1]|uniref:Uncharacterized protein n=1 Tax=Boletus edulis BED1 TaxID=1328754 RepID=A0AAD4G753_BOLED|nr:hypothetical protein L210DRAFT_2343894 [Boletus edulis BED1]